METARVATNLWSHTKTLTLIWLISFLLFYSFFHTALQNSSQMYPSSSSSSPGSLISNGERRARLYDKMARDLDVHGPAFLKQGETSQSSSLSYIFSIKDGAVKPVLKNLSLYHFSMFHATHHISPVPATEEEIEAEASAARAAAEGLCPVKVVSTGVLLGCWQVISGIDPITIRAKLRTALAHAPVKQLEPHNTSDQLRLFHELIDSLNHEIRGTEALVSELWNVEEYDLFVLAVDGRMKVRKFPLGCSGA